MCISMLGSLFTGAHRATSPSRVTRKNGREGQASPVRPVRSHALTWSYNGSVRVDVNLLYGSLKWLFESGAEGTVMPLSLRMHYPSNP
jgi:hypothetical protein